MRCRVSRDVDRERAAEQNAEQGGEEDDAAATGLRVRVVHGRHRVAGDGRGGGCEAQRWRGEGAVKAWIE